MDNSFLKLKLDIVAILEKEIGRTISFSQVVLEKQDNPLRGNLSTNSALTMARKAGISPLLLAEKIKQGIQSHSYIEDITVVEPGFINIRLKNHVWVECLRTILRNPEQYGSSMRSTSCHINIEYVSANPTGPLHIGHCRCAVVGDILANILERVGYKVTREYYVNDVGDQIDKFTKALHNLYCEEFGLKRKFIKFYLSPYLIALAKKLAKKDRERWVNIPENLWLTPLRKFAVEEMMILIREDLNKLGVHHDVFISEKDLLEQGFLNEVLDLLKNSGFLYNGILPSPRGKSSENLEKREQLLFKSSYFGDDRDRSLTKSDGSWSYFASDIAYHYNKFRRGAEKIINVLGSDHSGYLKRISSAVNVVTKGKVSFKGVICQLVKFIENGKEIRMSKRSGSFISLNEIIERVGSDAVRFMMVWRSNRSKIEFDFRLVTEQSLKNPIFYVQYAHTRCQSIIRHSKRVFPDLSLDPTSLSESDQIELSESEDYQLACLLALWPHQLELAAEMTEPHRIARYLYKVSSEFHSLWNKGKDRTEFRFVFIDDKKQTRNRLALVVATSIVLRVGLITLGIKPLDEM